MFRLNEWNPVVVDILVILVIISFLLYIFVLCFGDRLKWNDTRHFRCINRSMAFYFGMSLTILLNVAKDHGYLGRRPTDLILNQLNPYFGNLAFKLETLEVQSTGNVSRSSVIGSLLDNPEKVIFVTTTRYSLVQPAVLTKIGQALFPVRDYVIWVVVSITDAGDFGKQTDGHDGITPKTDNVVLMSLHLKSVERTLKRFGVSYVLLESHAYLNNQFHGFRVPHEQDRVVKGLQTGLIWSLQNFKNGALVLGHDEYAYNYRIFDEIRKTKVASSWAIGLGRKLGFSSPILASGTQEVKGYHNGNDAQWGDVLMEYGGFALNIEYLLQKVDANSIWKMTWDRVYTLASLGIELRDIQPLGENCTKILVWRTRVFQHPWPQVLKLKKHYQKTNMMKLIKNVYGVRNPYIKKYFNHTDQKFSKYY